jgi:hypothetical protein
LKKSIIIGGTPVEPLVRAAEVKVSLTDSIIGKKVLRKTKTIIGKAMATIIITIINVLLSTFICIFLL